MTPQAARIILLIAAVSISLLLLAAGGTINALAAVLVSGGAGPFCCIIQRANRQQALRDVYYTAMAGAPAEAHPRSPESARGALGHR